MLRVMRKHAQNWLMKAILFIIIIVFIFYFGSTRGRNQTETVAIVNDTRISNAEYMKEYQNLLDVYHERYGGQLTDELLKTLNPKKQALDTLIEQAVILSQADELGLTVTDDEIKNAVYSYPVFQKNGVFDKTLYEQRLRYQKMTPEDFEVLQKKTLLAAKLEGLIKESAKVSDAEAHDVYRIQNEKFNVEFVSVPCQSFAGRVTATEKDLENYLKNHGEEFREPRKADLKYIVFRDAGYATSSEVTDEDIESYWKDHEQEFGKADGTAGSLTEAKETIRAKLGLAKGMEAAFAAARKAHDTIYMEENFDGYAAKIKRNVETASIYETRPVTGPLAQLKDLPRLAFDSFAGDILPVISDESGLYVFKVAAIQPSRIPALGAIRETVRERYMEEESKNLCRKKADALLARMKQEGGMQRVASAENLPVAETGLFSPGPEVPGIGTSPDIAEALFEINAAHPFPGGVFFVNGNFVILHLKETGVLDAGDFDLKKDSLTRYLAKLKQENFFRSWLDGIKAAMAAQGKIQIIKDAAEL